MGSGCHPDPRHARPATGIESEHVDLGPVWDPDDDLFGGIPVWVATNGDGCEDESPPQDSHQARDGISVVIPGLHDSILHSVSVSEGRTERARPPMGVVK